MSNWFDSYFESEAAPLTIDDKPENYLAKHAENVWSKNDSFGLNEVSDPEDMFEPFGAATPEPKWLWCEENQVFTYSYTTIDGTIMCSRCQGEVK